MDERQEEEGNSWKDAVRRFVGSLRSSKFVEDENKMETFRQTVKIIYMAKTKLNAR